MNDFSCFCILANGVMYLIVVVRLVKKHHTMNYKHGKGRGLKNGLEGPPVGKNPLEHDILIVKSKEELYLIHKY